jgi:DNA-binding transcriptional ArsR family regulator
MPKSDVHTSHQAGSPLDAAVLESITETMPAFAAGSRVRLLYALTDGERTVGELAAIAQTTPAGVSQQLRILRNLKFVTARREGKSVYYRLYDDHVGTLLTEIRHHAEHALRGWATPGKAPGERGAVR